MIMTEEQRSLLMVTALVSGMRIQPTQAWSLSSLI